MDLSLAVLAGLLADAFVDERIRHWPRAAFWRLADRLEGQWNDRSVAAGGKTLAVLLLPLLLVAIWFVLSLPPLFAWLAIAALVWLAVGRRQLATQARAIANALAGRDLAAARDIARPLLARPTASMDEPALRAATIESVLEKANSAIVAPVFWGVLLGYLFGPAGAAVGLIGYWGVSRLAGHWPVHTERFVAFGQLANRVNDGLNWPSVRVAALAFVVMGHRRKALRCWREQSPMLVGDHSAPLKTAGAGALGIVLGMPAAEDDITAGTVTIGQGRAPAPGDIERALGLVDRAVAVLFAVVLLFGLR